MIANWGFLMLQLKLVIWCSAFFVNWFGFQVFMLVDDVLEKGCGNIFIDSFWMVLYPRIFIYITNAFIFQKNQSLSTAHRLLFLKESLEIEKYIINKKQRKW